MGIAARGVPVGLSVGGGTSLNSLDSHQALFRAFKPRTPQLRKVFGWSTEPPIRDICKHLMAICTMPQTGKPMTQPPDEEIQDGFDFIAFVTPVHIQGYYYYYYKTKNGN